MDPAAIAETNCKPLRLLVLGPDQGWHADRLRSAAETAGHNLQFARYESLAASLDGHGRHRPGCSLGTLESFDAILTRTMPTGSLEQITFRLATLHSLIDSRTVVVNPPHALETAIDKYATLTAVSALGYEVPATVVVQSRREAMEAFQHLGGDVVVKPIFGGEGRGVMRVQDAQLAWFTFATLERLDAVCYVQQFVPPGGIDTRYFVIGDDVWGIRREASEGWRTNVSQGGQSVAVPVSESQRLLALRVARRIGIEIGSVDVLEASDGIPRVLEVNGVPGWKGASSALQIDLAAAMIRHVEILVASRRQEFADIMEPPSDRAPLARPTE